MATAELFGVEHLVGRSLRVNYGPGNRNNGLFHVRAVVDEEWLVVRRWSGGDWSYRLEHIAFYETLDRSGYLSVE